jgi:hypothetical protein
MKKLITAFLLILLYVLASPTLQAQQPISFVHAGFGMNQFRGDLQADHPAYTPSLQLGIQLNRSKRLNGSLGIGYGTISGQNSNYRFAGDELATPNRFFSSSYLSVQYDLHLNILKKERYMLYLSQGLGLLRYKPEDDLGRSLLDRYDTRPPNETYGNSAIMLPTKLGALYLFPNQWGIGLEAGYLNSLTDYLDNISQWGNKDGNDNVLQFQLRVYVPLKRKEKE